MNTSEGAPLSIQEITVDGFWTLYLSVMFLVIVITVATLLRPPNSASTIIPENAARASFGATLVPLPLGNIDSLDPTTIGVITSMVTNHNLTAKILIGGDPASEAALREAKKVEQEFKSVGVTEESLKTYITPRLAANTAEVHFDKDPAS